MENQFGNRIKALRESQNLLQRQIASILEIDTPMLSKIERGERKAKKEQVLKFAEIFKVDSDDLLTLWLANKVYDIVKDQDLALKAMEAVEEEIKSKRKRKS